MVIVLTGGGSGGHITPLLAVADELKHLVPEVELIYIGQTGDHLVDVPGAHPNIDEVFTIRAGKFRRYHGEGIKQLLDAATLLKNFRDFFLVLVGIWQAYRLLKKLKPSVVFTPGGFVGVPVGIASRLRNIPFVTHDLDATPGLANKINARWAVAHAVAMPKELYRYPADKTYEVGVPVSTEYQLVTPAVKQEYRNGLGIKEGEKVICITGGGLGAQRLNTAIAKALPGLFHKYPGLTVLHIAGRINEKELADYYKKALPENSRQIIVKGFVNDLYRYSAAADIIICRAGATNLAEFAIQHKPVIVVPNPVLTGGHQLKNAQYLVDAGAVKMVDEASLKQKSDILVDEVSRLFDHLEEREALASNLGSFSRPDAAQKLATVILQSAKK